MTEYEKLSLLALKHVLRGIDQVLATRPEGAKELKEIQPILDWIKTSASLIARIEDATNQR
jgi:hypothetical protein